MAEGVKVTFVEGIETGTRMDVIKTLRSIETAIVRCGRLMLSRLDFEVDGFKISRICWHSRDYDQLSSWKIVLIHLTTISFAQSK